MDNSDYNYEEEIAKLFNPDDITQWQDMPPNEFFMMMRHELIREWTGIVAYTEFLEKGLDPDIIVAHGENTIITAGQCVGIILRRTRIMKRLSDTVDAYAFKYVYPEQKQ